MHWLYGLECLSVCVCLWSLALQATSMYTLEFQQINKTDMQGHCGGQANLTAEVLH